MCCSPETAALRQKLKTIPGFKIVGAAVNNEDALAQINSHRPHAVIVSISASASKRPETVQQLAHHHPDIRVMVLSEHVDESAIRNSLRAGVKAFLSASASTAEIVFAMNAILHDGLYLCPMACKTFVTTCGKCTHKPFISADPALTPRQREVLKLVAEGHTTKQVAHLLHLSAKTVETHRSQLMKQLHIHELAGLVRYAIRVGMVSVDA